MTRRKYPYTQRHGDGWRARIRVRGTVQVGPTRSTRREAYEDAIAMREEQTETASAGSALTIADAHELLLVQLKRKQRTAGTLDYTQRQFEAVSATWDPHRCPLTLLTKHELQWWIDQRAKGGASPNTIAKGLAYVGRLFDVAGRAERIPAGMNPASAVDRPDMRTPERESMPLDELIAAQNRAAADGYTNEAVLMKLLRLTGLRRSEVARLRAEDINTKAGVLEVPKPKVRALPRRIPMSNELRCVLQYLATGREAELFDDAMDITKALRRVSRHLGDPRIRAHAIRHGVGDAIAAATEGDVTTVGKILGHSPGSYRQTMRYCEAHDERVRDAQRALRGK